MRPVEYHRRGVPLESYEPTKADRRRQEEAERTAERVREIVADWPPLTPEQRDKIALILGVRTPDHELMRWRLRLCCGHIVEITQHQDHQQPSGSRICPECGLAPAAVVAYEPLGRVAEPPNQQQLDAPPRSRSARRAADQKRTAELEQEVRPLRAGGVTDDACDGA